MNPFSWLNKEIVIFTEYIAGGELKEFLKNKSTPFKESDAQTIFATLISALSYIHQNNVVHRDLKLENILLSTRDNPFDLKIIDFGISGLLSKVGGEVIHAGTMIYSPPEVVSK